MRQLEERVKSSGSRVSELEVENNSLKDLLKEARVEIITLRSVSSPPQMPKHDCDHELRPDGGKVVWGDLPNELVLRIDLSELMAGCRLRGISRCASTSGRSDESTED